MFLKKLLNWFGNKDNPEVISKWLTILAIIVGGIWSIYQFHIFDTFETNPQLSISVDIARYTDDLKLVAVHIKPKNIGHVRVEPAGDGIELIIKKYPKGFNTGYLDTNKIKPFLPPVTHIEKKYDGYIIESGIEFDEVVTFILPKNEIYLIEANMDLDKETSVSNYYLLDLQDPKN